MGDVDIHYRLAILGISETRMKTPRPPHRNNQINHIQFGSKYSRYFEDVKVRKCVDVGSYHNLIMVTLKLFFFFNWTDKETHFSVTQKDIIVLKGAVMLALYRKGGVEANQLKCGIKT